MGRRPSYHWDRKEQCWRTDTGNRTKYFRRIGRHEHSEITQAFAAYLAELDAEARPPGATVDDLCLAFLRAARGVKKRTVRTHAERLKAWCEWVVPGEPGILGGRTAADTEAKHLRLPLRAWEAAGLSDHYRAGICRSVKAAFAWATSEDGGRLIPINPFTEVKGPTIGRAPERYADRVELARFLRFAWRRAGAAPGVYRRFGRSLVLLMRVAIHTGARPGELCTAWWPDFDPERGAIVIPPERHKTGSKVKQDRVIFLPPALVRTLQREHARPERHPVFVFTHKRGKGGIARGADMESGEPWPDSSSLSAAIRKVRTEAIAAGVPVQGTGDNRFVLYRLRHTYISDGLMGGVRGASIAAVTGTSERMVNQVYGHLLDDHLAETAEAIRAGRKRSGK